MLRTGHLSLALPRAFPWEMRRLLSVGNAEGTKLGGRIYAPLCQCTTLTDGYPNGPLAAERSRGAGSPNWRANDELGHDKQSQYTGFSLCNVSQCVICSPVWRFVCHVIASCKWPIFKLKFYFQSEATINIVPY